MKNALRFCLSAFWFACPVSLACAAEWRAVENIKTYAIAGKTGPDLYASIGERGPQAADASRAIAHTNFKLTWTRDYQPRNGGCVLASARPKLTITYFLPKPSNDLPSGTAKLWREFAAGVEKHERVHGDFIKEMVRSIESASVGLSTANDPNCRTIRTELTAQLSKISDAQRQRSRDFDRVELSDGGNVHQLILKLVNGS